LKYLNLLCFDSNFVFRFQLILPLASALCCSYGLKMAYITSKADFDCLKSLPLRIHIKYKVLIKHLNVTCIFSVPEANTYVGISRLGQNQKPRNCFSSAPFDPSFVVWDGAPLSQPSSFNRGMIIKGADGVVRFKFADGECYIICQE